MDGKFVQRLWGVMYSEISNDLCIASGGVTFRRKVIQLKIFCYN